MAMQVEGGRVRWLAPSGVLGLTPLARCAHVLTLYFEDFTSATPHVDGTQGQSTGCIPHPVLTKNSICLTTLASLNSSASVGAISLGREASFLLVLSRGTYPKTQLLRRVPWPVQKKKKKSRRSKQVRVDKAAVLLT